MSNFTTEVRWICENAYNNAHPDEHGSIADMISAGRGTIFDFQYPIFDENYRGVLETKILKHYYTREIGEETVALWKLRLDARMNEIMPFYNKLYSSELLQFNPLYDVDVTRRYMKEGTATKTETDNGTQESSDTMTGTVGDSGTASGTTSNTRTLGTTSSTDITVEHTGTVTDAETGTISVDNTGTIGDSGTTSETKSVTGTVGDSGTSGNTKTRTGTERTQGETTVDGTVITANSGTDTENTERDNKNDHWDYYSDTPQGTIGFIPGSSGTPQADTSVRNQTYLTNVRHITDDTDGSTEDRTMTHGHRIQADDDTTTEVDSTLTLNTTETDQGTSTNTRTYNTADTTSGTNANTRTLNTSEDTESSKRNVRTFSNTDTTEQTVSDTGTIRDSGTSSDTTANTRTYNTTNAKESETTNTATGSYTNLDEYTETVQGKHGSASYAKMLMEFRETFLNIDAMIIENLSDLFFGLWG